MLARLSGMAPEQKAEMAEMVSASTGGSKFIPSPGPQTDAWFCKADVLLYGGQAGGGKSALLCGLALEEHKRSLLMRRKYVDLQGGGGLIDELLRLHGSRAGFNGSAPPTLRTDDGRVVTFGGATHVGDEQSFQGRARDLLGVDEAAQFTKSQIDFLMGWVRSDDPDQRVRTVLASNPPITSDGDWIVGMFRPWLDPTHHNPAKHGELRWFVTAPDGTDLEVDDASPIELSDGRTYQPTSRSFIPASLGDNPFLRNTDYASRLDAMPEPLRSAMRDGNFMLARQDDQWQVIPTQWVREAQSRWTDERPKHAPMSALGVDIAQGGADQTVIAARYDGWYAPIEAFPGSTTPTGRDVAALVFTRRQNGATVILDMGGGWGGATHEHLFNNGLSGPGELVKHVGAKASVKRTADQSLGFHNKRAETYWRFREALDPSQDGGSSIALPPDPELVSDLTAPTYDATSGKIKIEAKEDLVKRLGRSPDKGDAVVMAWSSGPRLMTHGNQWRQYSKQSAHTGKPNVVRATPGNRRK